MLHQVDKALLRGPYHLHITITHPPLTHHHHHHFSPTSSSLTITHHHSSPPLSTHHTQHNDHTTTNANANATAATATSGHISHRLQRYYKAASYFCDIKGNARHDQVVLQHSNGLCVVCLAPSHPLRAPGAARPVEVRFRGDLASKKPSGKKKIGATFVVEYSPLCDVTCDDGSVYVSAA